MRASIAPQLRHILTENWLFPLETLFQRYPMLKPDTSGYPASTRHSTTYYWIQCIMYITKSISGSNTSRHFSFLCGPKNHTAGFKLKISISPSEIIIHLTNLINFNAFTTVKILIVEHPPSGSGYIGKVTRLVVTLHHMWNTEEPWPRNPGTGK